MSYIVGFTITLFTFIVPQLSEQLTFERSNSDSESTKTLTQILQNVIKNSPIADLSGYVEGGLEYDLTNMSVSEFSCTVDAITLNDTGEILLLKGKNINSRIKGKWEYEFQNSWVHHKGNGTFTLKISRISITLPMTISMQNGSLIITPGVCKSTVDYLKLEFKGPSAWIINPINKRIQRELKDLFKSQVCILLKDNINVFAESLQ